MVEEIQKFHTLDSFEYDELPTEVRPIPSRWHFTLKENTNGVVIDTKARFVAKRLS